MASCICIYNGCFCITVVKNSKVLGGKKSNHSGTYACIHLQIYINTLLRTRQLFCWCICWGQKRCIKKILVSKDAALWQLLISLLFSDWCMGCETRDYLKYDAADANFMRRELKFTLLQNLMSRKKSKAPQTDCASSFFSSCLLLEDTHGPSVNCSIPTATLFTCCLSLFCYT